LPLNMCQVFSLKIHQVCGMVTCTLLLLWGKHLKTSGWSGSLIAETTLVAAIWSNMQCNTYRLMLTNSPFTPRHKTLMNWVFDAFWWMVLWKSVTQSSSLRCFTLMTFHSAHL
jgi:hypothetical protein